MKHKIEIYFAKDGWRYRVVARNGKIVADSGEAYASKSNVKRAAVRLVAVVNDARIVMRGDA